MCYKTVIAGIYAVFFAIAPLYGDVAVTDMVGRKIVCPSGEEVKRVFATSYAMSCVLYVLAPDKLCALNKAINPEASRYLGDAIKAKDVLGGWLGFGKPANIEALLKHHPQIIFAPDYKRKSGGKYIENTIKRYNIPLLYADIHHLDKLPESFTFIGRVIGRKERGLELAATTREFLKRISKISKNGKKVYYASGTDGLSSYSGRSPETEAIYLAGGVNAIDLKGSFNGRQKKNRRVTVNFEYLLKIDPDVIIVNSRQTGEYIKKNPAWSSLSAVKNNRVYLIPLQPISWINRPPSFPRLLGALWLAGILDSSVISVTELKKYVRLFYKSFYRYELTEAELNNFAAAK